MNSSIKVKGILQSGSQINDGSTQNYKKPFCIRPESTIAQENLSRQFCKFFGTKNQININMPLRVDIPSSYNIPERFENEIQHWQASSQKEDQLNKECDRFDIPSKTPLNNIEIRAKIYAQKRLKDYNFLALACRRAGKSLDEGRAYFAIGILFDNIGKFNESIDNYRKFLHICRAIKDKAGEALGYNCIGVSFLNLGIQESNNNYIEKSIEFNKLHMEFSDNYGKYIGAQNLAICYELLNKPSISVDYRKLSLDFALSLQDNIPKITAIENYGKIGSQKSTSQDLENLEPYIKLYLDMVTEVKDKVREVQAYIKMGEIVGKHEQYEDSIIYYKQAIKIADLNNDLKGSKQANISLGLAQGKLSLVNTQQSIQQNDDYLV